MTPKSPFRVVINSFLFFAFIFFSNNSIAQLTAWQYRDAISVFEKEGKLKSDFPILIKVDTKRLIEASKMKADGSDIRFSMDCNGATLLDYYIESGINTENTLIWVKVPSLPANGAITVILFYGNTAATAASNSAKIFITKRTINQATVLAADSGEWKYDLVEITANGSITLGPTYGKPFVINARKIIINGSITADGAGYAGGNSANGTGPGGGKVNSSTGGAGAGSYGGNGGVGGYCCDAPAARGLNGDVSGTASGYDIDMGSGGAGAKSIYAEVSLGGNGGSVIYLKGGIIQINANLSANGGDGHTGYQCSAGGSGGGIFVSGAVVGISASSTLSANGGIGGSTDLGMSGGGGGGGRVKIFAKYSLSNLGSIKVDGGQFGTGGGETEHATKGESGTKYLDTFNSYEPSVVVSNGLNPKISLVPEKTITCDGKNVLVNTIFSNGGAVPIFEWFLNDVKIADQTESKIDLNNLKDADKLYCKFTSNSTCLDGSAEAYSDTVQFTILPALIANFSSNPDSGSNTGQKVYFTALTANADSFLWNFGDGSAPASGKKVNHIYVAEGFYSVNLIVLNSNCLDSISKEHEVNDNITFGINNGIKLDSYFKIYPNPSNGIINIQSMNSSVTIGQISIVDISGREILSTQNNNINFDIIKLRANDLSKGIYLLKLTSSKGIFVKPLIIN